MEELYKQLAALARQHGARRLVLFGSRARGDNRYNSDVDLAVYGMPESNRANFWMDCEDLPTLLKFDIVHITDGMNPAFMDQCNYERNPSRLSFLCDYAPLCCKYTFSAKRSGCYFPESCGIWRVGGNCSPYQSRTRCCPVLVRDTPADCECFP